MRYSQSYELLKFIFAFIFFLNHKIAELVLSQIKLVLCDSSWQWSSVMKKNLIILQMSAMFLQHDKSLLANPFPFRKESEVHEDSQKCIFSSNSNFRFETNLFQTSEFRFLKNEKVKRFSFSNGDRLISWRLFSVEKDFHVRTEGTFTWKVMQSGLKCVLKFHLWYKIF